MVVGFWVWTQLALYKFTFVYDGYCLYEYYLVVYGFCHRLSVISYQSPPTQSARFFSHGDNWWMRGLYADSSSSCCVDNFQQYQCDNSSCQLHVHLTPRMLWALSATSSSVSVFRILTQTRLDLRGIVGSLLAEARITTYFSILPGVHAGHCPTLPAFQKDRNSARNRGTFV